MMISPDVVIGWPLVALYVTWKEVIPRLARNRTHHNGSPVTVGLAGQQTTDYWKLEFQRILGDAIDDKIMPLMERQTDIMESMSKTLQKLAFIEEFRKRD